MRKYIFALFILAIHPAFSQSGKQEKVLPTASVQAAKVVHQPDGLHLYPTKEQKSASTTGYNLLHRLSLPAIRVDDVSHTISALDNRGNVQVRINGIVSDKSDLLSIDPQRVRRVEYINQPGVRYGDDVAYVLNIVLSMPESGYTIGTDVTQVLNKAQGSQLAYGRWNRKRSEWSASAYFDYDISNGIRQEESARYHLNDGSLLKMQRNDTKTESRQYQHNYQLKYHCSDTANYVFQAALKADFGARPKDFRQIQVNDGTTEYFATEEKTNHTFSPSLDLYYSHTIAQGKTLVLNLVGTSIATDSENRQDEKTMYRYGVKGRTYSLMSEALFENRLRPFTLTVGLNHKLKHTNNEYTQDAAALNRLYNNDLYGFAEIKGNAGKFSYTAGTGVSYRHYRQGDNRYNYWLLRWKGSLTYRLSNDIQISYTLQSGERFSKIAMISDATIRNNSMEWTVGNPDLKPNRDLENILRINYAHGRWETFAEAYIKNCLHPNMEVWERTSDNRFIHTQRNQKEIDALHFSAYVNYWIIPERLSASLYGGMFRCLNFGDNYTHCYTSYFWTMSLQAYIKKFSLMAYADNGSSFLEGEHKGFNGRFVALQTSYSFGNFQASVTWRQPFAGKYMLCEYELLHSNLQKVSTTYDLQAQNRIAISLNWKLNRGRKYRSAEKRIQQEDKDAVILK